MKHKWIFFLDELETAKTARQMDELELREEGAILAEPPTLRQAWRWKFSHCKNFFLPRQIAGLLRPCSRPHVFLTQYWLYYRYSTMKYSLMYSTYIPSYRQLHLYTHFVIQIIFFYFVKHFFKKTDTFVTNKRLLCAQQILLLKSSTL